MYGGVFAVFKQSFPRGVRGTAVSPDGNRVLSGYPTFRVDGSPARGFVSFCGRFLEASRAGAWTSSLVTEAAPAKGAQPANIRGPDIGVGISGGPFAVFEDAQGGGDALVFSPA